MQEFLKEWGPAVITAVAVLVIVAVVAALQNSLGTMFGDLLNTVQQSSNKIVNDKANIDAGIGQQQPKPDEG